MNIHLYKDYWLQSDSLQFFLTEIKKNEKGEDYEANKWSHGTLESLFNSMCWKEIRRSKATTSEGLEREVAKMTKVCKEWADKIGADKIMTHICRQSKEFLAQGDPPKEDKPNPAKRGRKKKE